MFDLFAIPSMNTGCYELVVSYGTVTPIEVVRQNNQNTLGFLVNDCRAVDVRSSDLGVVPLCNRQRTQDKVWVREALMFKFSFGMDSSQCRPLQAFLHELRYEPLRYLLQHAAPDALDTVSVLAPNPPVVTERNATGNTQ